MIIVDYRLKGSEIDLNIFISFSGDGREKYAVNLLKIYSSMGLNCWYDRHELYLGDNLKNTIIKDGIDKSDYCVLFINKTFLNREWPCEEANLFLKKYVDSQEQRIFPILVNVSKEEVLNSKISRILEIKYQFLNNANTLENIAMQMLNCILHVEIRSQAIQNLDDTIEYYKRLSKRSHINIYNALSVLSHVPSTDYKSRTAILLCLSSGIKSMIYDNMLDKLASLIYNDNEINEQIYGIAEALFILRTNNISNRTIH